jgi:hypothetical protein
MSAESVLCETCSRPLRRLQFKGRCPIETETVIDQRLTALESQIAELKSLILQKKAHMTPIKKNKRPRARFEPASWPPQGGFLNINPKMGLFSNGLPQYQRESQSGCAEVRYHHSNNLNLVSMELEFTKQELKNYTEFRLAGISKASIPWMKRCSLTFWKATKGIISKERCDALRQHLSTRYTDVYAPRKVLNFATAFLKYLAKTHFDARYQAFELFLEMPKGLKVRKHVTSRIITKEDVENVLSAIQTAYQNNEIDWDHYLHFKAIVLFSAFTGQRPQATTARLTVGQFKTAISQKKSVIDVLPEQDKIRMQHYCPLHPQVVDTVRPLLEACEMIN